MAVLTNMNSNQGEWLRKSLQPFATSTPEEADVIVNGPPTDHHSPNIPGSPQPQQHKLWEEEMEELLYAMAMWLLSHRLLCQIQDYVVVESISADGNPDNELDSSSRQYISQSDEKILKELVESDCLDGNISIPAICWRMSLEPAKLRKWALRHPRARIISRMPLPGDDWEPVA